MQEIHQATTQEKTRENALLRHHLLKGLITKYLDETEPKILWERLNKWYDHNKDVLFPKAKNERRNL